MNFLVGLLATFLFFHHALITHSNCPVVHKQQVVLRSAQYDPRVLLWTDRKLFTKYVEGDSIGDEYALILNTKLVAPDTKAVVTASCSDKEPYSIGVMIESGLHRGATGFVDLDDIKR